MKFLVLLSTLLSCFFVQANQQNETRQNELNERLYHAVVEGNAEEAKKAIEAGADPNAFVQRRSGSIEPPLFYVEDPETAQVLIDAGANPNPQLVSHPLHHIKPPETVRILLKAGADPKVIKV